MSVNLIHFNIAISNCICKVLPSHGGSKMKETLRFQLNGNPVELEVTAEHRLLWVIRTELGLTGTKYGCGKGLCGSCTVLVDDQAVRSCVVPVSFVKGKKVLTIEGLSENGDHPLQKAFMEQDALQCGFCTPGMLLTAYGFLLRNPSPTEEQIIQAMDHNLCRCGSNNRIIQAIQSASLEMRTGRAK